MSRPIRLIQASLLCGCGGEPTPVSPPPPVDPPVVTEVSEQPCAASVQSSVHLDAFACTDRSVTLKVSDIGNAVFEVSPGPLDLTVSAWRLEGFAVRSGGQTLCLPELEPCSPAVGTASVERVDTLRGPWTWTVHLDAAPSPLEVAWIDAYR